MPSMVAAHSLVPAEFWVDDYGAGSSELSDAAADKYGLKRRLTCAKQHLFSTTCVRFVSGAKSLGLHDRSIGTAPLPGKVFAMVDHRDGERARSTSMASDFRGWLPCIPTP